MDPIISNLTQKALTNTVPSGGSSPAGSSGNSSFKEVLGARMDQSTDMNAKLMEFVDNTFGSSQPNVNAVDASSIHVEVAKVKEVETSPNGNYILDVLKEVNGHQSQLQNIQEMMSSGKTFKPQELLAIQTGVQTWAMEMELVGKACEHATRIPQTLTQMQIG